jgi:hypothetical protein
LQQHSVQKSSNAITKPVLSLIDVSYKLMGKVPFDYNK